MVKQMATTDKLADCPHLEVVKHGWKWQLVCDERTDKERERDDAHMVMPDSEECRAMSKRLTKYGFLLYCDDEEK